MSAVELICKHVKSSGIETILREFEEEGLFLVTKDEFMCHPEKETLPEKGKWFVCKESQNAHQYIIYDAHNKKWDTVGDHTIYDCISFYHHCGRKTEHAIMFALHSRQ